MGRVSVTSSNCSVSPRRSVFSRISSVNYCFYLPVSEIHTLRLERRVGRFLTIFGSFAFSLAPLIPHQPRLRFFPHPSLKPPKRTLRSPCALPHESACAARSSERFPQWKSRPDNDVCVFMCGKQRGGGGSTVENIRQNRCQRFTTVSQAKAL